jgi:hypothetical protein
MDTIEQGISIAVRPQREKQNPAICCSFESGSNVNVTRFSQPEKHDMPQNITEQGI